MALPLIRGMNEMQHFQELKRRVLERYRQDYPYFQGDWKTFSSQDILNLIALLERECKETVSEKWIYTHLKPETNTKLPRKNMLHVLCRFVGVSGWDEFIFEPVTIGSTVVSKEETKRSKRGYLWGIGMGVLLLAVAYFLWPEKKVTKMPPIKLQNQYTQEAVDSSEVQVYDATQTVGAQPLTPQQFEEKVREKPLTVFVKSPFYKDTIVQIPPTSSVQSPPVVALQPDDYAMMVKAFLKADITDWQKRKTQLQQILSEDLEVMVMLKGGLGAEFYNKAQFVQKLTIPTPVLKRWEIVDIKNEPDGKLKVIRIKQE
ncbi:hypothetical protein [Flavobacterium fontis]|nr:hypothetical protein [Flavobacterium fontis]